MLRFLCTERDGGGQKAKQPKRKEEYEATRTRKFQPTWKTKFPWINYVVTNGTGRMICTVCRKYESSGPFVTGCSNMRIDTLRIHERSSSHLSNTLKQKAKSAKPGSTPAEKSLLALQKDVFQRLRILFRSAHALGKCGRPFSDFPWILSLQESNGVDVGTSYRNDKRVVEFLHCIAQVEIGRSQQIIDEAKFISLISDGATDSSHQEGEILYVRITHQGKVNIRFVGIQNVGKADAANIESTVNNLMNGKFGDLWQQKVVGMGTDGASVMVGKCSGVVKRLKDRLNRPYILGVHCSAHKLELSYRDACKDINLYKKVDSLLLNLYYFYRNSPLNRYNLKQSFIAAGMPVLMPSRVGGTRWLSHIYKAVKTLLSSYKPIVNQLSQLAHPDMHGRKGDAAAKAKNFLSLLHDRSVVVFLHLLMDLTGCLSKVSKVFQDRSTTVGNIHKEVIVAKTVIESYHERDGPMLSAVIDESFFQETELLGNLKSFESARKHLLSNLVKSLERRFGGENDVLRAMSVVLLPLWPAKLHQDPDFGDKHIRSLVEQFGDALEVAGYDAKSIEEEWITFKKLLYESFDDVPALDWPRINTGLGSRCSAVLSLVDLILCLPASSAEAERGFSYMKKTKTDWRSRLSSSHLSDLLTVALEAPEIGSFNADEAIHIWNQKSRYPDRHISTTSQSLSDTLTVSASQGQSHENEIETPAVELPQVQEDEDLEEGIPEDFIEEDFYSDDSDVESRQSIGLMEKKAYDLFQNIVTSAF